MSFKSLQLLPEDQLHVSRFNVFEVDDRISGALVFVKFPGKESGKISGTDGENELVSVEVDAAAGEGDVGEDLAATQLLHRAEEDGVVVVPLQAEVLAYHGGVAGEVDHLNLELNFDISTLLNFDFCFPSGAIPKNCCCLQA